MKNDQNKPQARRFYWHGLSLLVSPELKAIIKAYNKFVDCPSIPLLKTLFMDCRAYNEPQMDMELLRIYEYGAQKYADKNYLALNLDRILDAMGRHLVAVGFGKEKAEDSQLSHFGHVVANVLIAAELLSSNH